MVHKSLLFVLLLFYTPVFASEGAPYDIYRLVADKYGVDAVALYDKATDIAGRPVAFSDHKAPWPWTLRYCVDEDKKHCETVFARDRESLFNTARFCVDQGFTVALGPLLMPWAESQSFFGGNLWVATDPRVNINMVVRRGSIASHIAHGAYDGLPGKTISLTDLRALVDNLSALHNIDPLLVFSIIRVESNYQPDAVSNKGAVGLMQLMPETGKRFGVLAEQRTDPVKNIAAGVKYLSYLSKLYNGDTTLMLAAYNAGEGAVKKYNNTIPPYKETQDYVLRVLNHYVLTNRQNEGHKA